jgi:sulfite exporter TauE/SafE
VIALLVAAASAGLVGSLHCAAMCGPLAIAGCQGRRAAVGYFAGRLVSYATIGALLGHVGSHALCFLPMRTVQSVTLVLAAGFAAWRAWVHWRGRRGGPDPGLVRLGRPPRRSLLAAVLPVRGLGLGLATGFLPCGMLLPAWTLAMGSGSAGGGAAVMAMFSVATLPGLIVPLLGRALLRRPLPPAACAAAWATLALWLALRPLFDAVHQH